MRKARRTSKSAPKPGRKRGAAKKNPAGSVATPAEIRAAKADTPARYRELQRLMFRAVTRPLLDDESNPVWDDGRPAKELLAAFVKGDDFRNPLERVRTYNRMYWYRTLDSLWDDFPGVRAIAGKKFFPLAVAYLEKHPSTSFTMRHLGRKFPGWLRKQSGGSLPAATASAAADCAELEWALSFAFEAESAPAPDPAKFADPARLKLALQPHLTLLKLKHAAPEFLHALRLAENDHAGSGNAAAGAAPGAKEKSPSKKPRIRKKDTLAVVFRTPENSLRSLVLGEAEFAMLEDFAPGRTLGSALIRAMKRKNAPDAAAVSRFFSDWTARGWLAAR